MSRPTRGTAEITAEVALLLEGMFGMALLLVERAPSMAGRLQVVIELWDRLGSELTTAERAECPAGTAAPDWTAIDQAKTDGAVRRAGCGLTSPSSGGMTTSPSCSSACEAFRDPCQPRRSSNGPGGNIS